MSRATQQNGVAQTRRAGDEDGELSAHLRDMQLRDSFADLITDFTSKSLEICPVCKSSRYLNPKMRFLVNPECYHKMCESCVDRIFSQGPAPCPVAGCARTLRKAKFRKQTFDDIKVEREVDIRRRIAAVFNRREEEFTDLLSYNNYLEEVETLTFNLIEGIDVPATEAKLRAYAEQNARTITRNKNISTQEHTSASAQRAAQKESVRLRREAARKEEDDERLEKEEGKREVLNRLAQGGPGDADTIANEAQKVILKKSTARRSTAEKARQQVSQTTDSISTSKDGTPVPEAFVIKGLKPIEIAEPEKAYDAFDHLRLEHVYYNLQSEYEYPWLEKAKADPQITVGGYDVREYYARTLMEAFSGLGVFVGEEVREKESGGVREIVAAGAADGAGGRGGGGGDVSMGDDVF
ncbi:MAG: TFIIH/NER complex subunit [Icmadophila ericetorum]|nr:TFIIH/NER complex subunit [Icmadophila ericetorum]